MTTHTPPRVFLLALVMTGCGGGTGVTESETQRELLRDVPELRAASEGRGGTSSDGGGSTTPASRHASTSVAVGSGTEQFTGRFGGPELAQSLSPECPGWVSAQPNHVIHVPAMPFAQLVVDSTPHDTTLAVQLPDGSFRCNDDTNGLNPAVQLEPLAAGQLRVWVGSYSEGGEGDYQMIFTTERSLGVSSEETPPEF